MLGVRSVSRDARHSGDRRADFLLRPLREGHRGPRAGPHRVGPPADPVDSSKSQGQDGREEGHEDALCNGRHGPRVGASDVVPQKGRQVLRAVGECQEARKEGRSDGGKTHPARPAPPRGVLQAGDALQGPAPRRIGPAQADDGPRRRRRRRRRTHLQGRDVHRRRNRRGSLPRRRLRQERRRQGRTPPSQMAKTRPGDHLRLRAQHGRVHGRRRLHRHQGRTRHHRRGLHARPSDAPLVLPPRTGSRQRQVRHQRQKVRRLPPPTKAHRTHRQKLARRRTEEDRALASRLPRRHPRRHRQHR
mmetsp:Transcript_34143/g.109560  ORF Transcript_34143/g.109560 Transcript_34143/m.109560 type:complete len:303 (+) Transcript_34143:1684-2592(+)